MAAEPKPVRPADRSALRLELMKLVHRHDLSPEQLADRVTKLEAFVQCRDDVGGGEFQPPATAP